MENNIFKNLDQIITDRLLLRKLQLLDAEHIYEFTSLKNTSEGLSWDPHKNVEVTMNFINSVLQKYEMDEPSQWAVESKNENKVIGIAGFIAYSPEHSKGEIAYVLSPKYQGMGLMTEALFSVIKYGFEKMELNRIEAKCEINNFASERVMQKLGMSMEGCSRQYLFRKSKYRDYKFYAILRSDYGRDNKNNIYTSKTLSI